MDSNDGSRKNGQLTSHEELKQILSSFPSDEVVHAFGYGSGVFSQVDNKPSLVDMILVVRDSVNFHRANLEQHPHHYSCALRLGGNAARFQRFGGAKVLFFLQDDMKYGVVQKEDLIRDLLHWDYLYLAGRLHKPTATILQDEQVAQAQQCNLNCALVASILLTGRDDKDSIPLIDIYHRIASLSYAGDFRMQMGGEDPEKVSKLVQSEGQLERFKELYHKPLQGLNDVVTLDNQAIRWKNDPSVLRNDLWKRLPSRLQKGNPTMDRQKLSSDISAIVAPAARYQSLKGLLTTDMMRSLRYAGAKLSKGLFRG